MKQFFAIAKISMTSLIDIHVPTRALLDAETKGLLFGGWQI